MLKLFLLLFIYTVPIAMVKVLGYATIPVSLMLCVGYVEKTTERGGERCMYDDEHEMCLWKHVVCVCVCVLYMVCDIVNSVYYINCNILEQTNLSVGTTMPLFPFLSSSFFHFFQSFVIAVYTHTHAHTLTNTASRPPPRPPPAPFP